MTGSIHYVHFHEYTEDGRDMLAEITFEVEYSVEPGQRASFWSEGFPAGVEEVRFTLVEVRISDAEDDESYVVPAATMGPGLRKTLTASFDRLYDVCESTRERVNRECMRDNEAGLVY